MKIWQQRMGVAVTVAAMAIAACGGSDDASVHDLTSDSPVATSTDAAPSASDAASDTSDDAIDSVSDGEQMFPDVIGAQVTASGDVWTVSATLSSPYDTPERYADAFRIMTPDGTVLAERILTHDHADEQPFTRSQSGVAIPDDVDVLTIEGRDLEFGYGGATFDVDVPR